jgi:hypothetical protein
MPDRNQTTRANANEETILQEFRYRNPFMEKSVNQDKLWDIENNTLEDVQEINQTAMGVLEDDIDTIINNPSHQTKVRILIGEPGSGKTHLVFRLRRHFAGRAMFFYAPNPPITRPDATWSWLLNKVGDGLRRRHVNERIKPYSQLQSILYTWLLPKLNQPRSPRSIDEIHDCICKHHNPDEICKQVNSRLQQDFPDCPENIHKALAKAFHPQLGDIAARWLSGSEQLDNDELQAINQENLFTENEPGELFRFLGMLSEKTNIPLVLVLDQLEQIGDKHIEILANLVYQLIDQSRCWYLVLSVTLYMHSRLQDKLRGFVTERIGENNSVTLQCLTDGDLKRRIIECRLSNSGLRELRNIHALHDDYYPLTNSDILDLTGDDLLFPRALLELAENKYNVRTTIIHDHSNATVSALTLADKLQDELAAARDELGHPDELEVHGEELDERLIEWIGVVCDCSNIEYSHERGEFDGQHKGTDTDLVIAGVKIRLLGHHTQKVGVFPAFLKKVLKLLPKSLLVRDSKAPISGKTTGIDLNAFKQDKTFLHLGRKEIVTAYALGKVLAKMRDGDYIHWRTDREPTFENIKATLGKLPDLGQGEFIEQLFGLVQRSEPLQFPGPEIQRTNTIPDRQTPAIPAIPPPQLDPNLITAISRMMQMYRWLMLERLRRDLRKEYPEALADPVLYGAIETLVQRSEMECYPADLRTESVLHILIWTGDVNDA